MPRGRAVPWEDGGLLMRGVCAMGEVPAFDSMGFRRIVAELRRSDEFSGNQISLNWRTG
ncbi:MAG: hypothetical protein KF838_15385 [Phycisphaeraceae bacterium]|nr:MAG: hypothetical protein KF838_13265 [Phycisphaeraceae bacterium]QYK48160.1 MAG: hypothetical protein KF838_15385 [Phycisphaeraceae bacterium]